MNKLIYIAVFTPHLFFFEAACKENSLEKATRMSQQERKQIPSAVELTLKRLKLKNIDAQPGTHKSETINGIETEKWELILKNHKALKTFLYLTDHGSKATKLADLIQGTYPRTTNGPSVLVIESDPKKYSREINQILSAYSGEE